MSRTGDFLFPSRRLTRTERARRHDALRLDTRRRGRRRRLLALRLTLVVCLSLSTAMHAQAHSPARLTKQPAQTRAGAEGVTVYEEKSRALKVGQGSARELKGCDAHVYSVAVKAGEFLRLSLVERGVRVRLTVSDPRGEKITTSHPYFGVFFALEETEQWRAVSFIAEASGVYRLEVAPWDKFCHLNRVGERARRYEIKVTTLRVATPQDANVVAADRAVRTAQELEQESTPEPKLKAIAKYGEALALWRAVGDRAEMAETLTGIGNAYLSRGQLTLEVLRQAEEYYAQALSLWRALGETEREASLLSRMSLIQSNRQQALHYVDRALSVYRAAGNKEGEARLLRRASTFLGFAGGGDAPAMLPYIREGLQLNRALGNRHVEGEMLRTLAWYYVTAGDHERALEYLMQAIAIFRELRERRAEYDLLNDIGLLYSAAGDKLKALVFFNKTLALARDAANPQRQVEAYTLNNIGFVYLTLGDYRKALESLTPALEIYHSLSDRWGAGIALNNLGFTHFKLNDPEKAFQHLRQALEIHREVRNVTGEGDTLSNMMTATKALGLPRLAIFYGKQAVNAFEARRHDLRHAPLGRQQSFIKSKSDTYHQLADLLIAEGRLPEAQQVLGLLKQEEYFDFIRRDGAQDPSGGNRATLNPVEAEWERLYRQIADRVTAIGKERGELLRKRTRTPADEQRLSALEAQLKLASEAFQKFLDKLSDDFGNTKQAAIVEQLRESQGLMEDLRELGSGAVALYTIVGEEKYRVILVTPDVQKAFEYPIKAADLNRKVLAFREALQDRTINPLPLARELYDIIVAPLAQDLRHAQAQTLMWSLDGALRYLPLAALHDGERYLVEDYRNVVFTLASQPRWKDRPNNKWTALGLGVSKAQNGSASLPALPSVPEELRGIIRESDAGATPTGILPGKIMLNEAFTEEAMKAELRLRYPLVHIASHFKFKAGDEMNSFLLLGDGRHLTLGDIKYSHNLFAGVELLTLSACNTAIGGVGADGREVEGFGVLAQRQGAKAVVASLWAVADRSTRLLMQNFYHIRDTHPGMLKAEALRRAQLALLYGGDESGVEANRRRNSNPTSAAAPPDGAHAPQNKDGHPAAQNNFTRDPRAPYAHPYYWAPFILIGNWR